MVKIDTYESEFRTEANFYETCYTDRFCVDCTKNHFDFQIENELYTRVLIYIYFNKYPLRVDTRLLCDVLIIPYVLV